MNKSRTVYQLKYSKNEALHLLKRMYYSSSVVCLKRKRKKIEELLKVENFSLT